MHLHLLPTGSNHSFRVQGQQCRSFSVNVNNLYPLLPQPHCRTKWHRNSHLYLKPSKLNSFQRPWWIKKKKKKIPTHEVCADLSLDSLTQEHRVICERFEMSLPQVSSQQSFPTPQMTVPSTVALR